MFRRHEIAKVEIVRVLEQELRPWATSLRYVQYPFHTNASWYDKGSKLFSLAGLLLRAGSKDLLGGIITALREAF